MTNEISSARRLSGRLCLYHGVSFPPRELPTRTQFIFHVRSLATESANPKQPKQVIAKNSRSLNVIGFHRAAPSA